MILRDALIMHNDVYVRVKRKPEQLGQCPLVLMI